MRHEQSHRLDKFLTAGGVKKKGQKHEALTWVFGSSDRIRTGDLRLESEEIGKTVPYIALPFTQVKRIIA